MVPVMRWRAGLLLATALASGAAAEACSSESGQAPGPTGTPAPPIAEAGTTPAVACVKSPAASPFPSGACSAPRPPQPDAVDEALATMGLDRCTIGLPRAQSRQGLMDITDPRKLPDFEALLENPLRLPAYGAETAKWLDDAVRGETPVASAIVAAAVRRGTPVQDCPDPAWFTLDESDATPLATVALELDPDRDGEAMRAELAAVPRDLQRALVPIVRAMRQANDDVLAARNLTPAQLAQLRLTPPWLLQNDAIQWSKPLVAATDGVNVGAIVTAAARLATVIETAHLARFAGLEVPDIDIDTPLGAIVLRGPAAHTYLPGTKAEKALLVLDTGGDDVYRVPVAAATPDHAVSVAIDLGGKDLYGYVEKPTPEDAKGERLPDDGSKRAGGRTLSTTLREGAALFGIGLLFDYGAGDDTYRSLTASQGAAFFGVGVLFDEGGNDEYTAEALSQGAAAWGIGLLLDRAGNDEYTLYNQGQGFGFTLGVGALVDEAGDDVYFADPGEGSGLTGDAIYANAQLPGPTLKGNTSMVQGAGYGHRPDSPDRGYPFAGGLGILRDASGSDRYTCSVFGQATSFALGIGMLLDGAGDDTYEGLWYVQGANAHTSVAYFFDGAGNDKYNPTFPVAATSIGVGHDLSVALHVDLGGDDEYGAPGLSLGSGNANGVGILVNAGGNDVFRARGQPALGGASSTEILGDPYRKAFPTVGLFVKAGGNATYEIAGADAGYGGQSWSFRANASAGDGGAPVPEKSAGVDRPTGTASLP